MKDFFKGVRKHIDRLDAEKLREQYELVADAFAESEQIFTALKEGIVYLDATGTVLRANPAAKDLLGGEVADVLHDFNIPLGKSARLEFSVTYPEARTLEIQTIPFKGGTLVYIRDTTAEKARTEEELRSGATKAVCDLAAGVAHEIGNPLNAIAMNLQLLERDPADKESLEICKTQVKRLDGIIREFLSALRTRKPVLIPGSPADPLRNCLAALKPQLVERKIALTLDIPAALPATRLDKDLIEQVFFNILKNALEAMTDGAAIAIEIAADDQDVAIRFMDTGEGMTNEQLTHLFEPYRTTKEKGTGLGLMVSKRIITDHGGTIAVESEVGRGTTFIVKLPRIERRVRQLKG